VIRKIGLSLVISVVIFFVIAIGLVYSDQPAPATPEPGKGMAFESALAIDYSDLPESQTYKARDGAALLFRRYDGSDGPERFIILVHGSAWHGMQFHAMAKQLASGSGTVIVPDMRGHGAKPARRGDIDYISQLEDDIADLITNLKRDRPGAQIVLGGHSSGGGFVLRFAGGDHGGQADAFILLAPFLKYNAPTTRENSGGWAQPAVRRIIGLTMLNAVGVTAFNDLPVISFAMPESVLKGPFGHTATLTYTYRMNTGFAPHADYEADLATIKKPLLVVAGAEDESFYADRYEEVISAHNSTGTYHVLPGVNHLGVVTQEAATSKIAAWLAALPAR